MDPFFLLVVLASALLAERASSSDETRSSRLLTGLARAELDHIRSWAKRQLDQQTALAMLMDRYRSIDQVPDAVLAALQRDYLDWQVTHPVDPVYFASGSNQVGDIRGFSAIGQPIGVVAHYCKGDCRAALAALAGSGLRVFVDSGAFREVDRNLAVVRPLTDEDWASIFELYRDVAGALKSLAHVVAPDRIGDQVETLARQDRYKTQIQQIARLGARILVPVQPGPMSLSQFFSAELEALGLPAAAVIPAIPSAKSAVPTDQVVAFLEESGARSIHLLGLGPRSARYPELLTAIRQVDPTIRIFMDSAFLPAHAVRKEGPAGGPRRLMSAQDLEDERLKSRRWFSEDHLVDAGGLPILDYTEAMGDLEIWMTPAVRRRVAAELGWSGAQLRSFTTDPDGFLQTKAPSGETWWSLPEVGHAIDQAWAAYRDRAEVSERRTLAISRAMTPLLPGHDLVELYVGVGTDDYSALILDGQTKTTGLWLRREARVARSDAEQQDGPVLLTVVLPTSQAGPDQPLPGPLSIDVVVAAWVIPGPRTA